jgi:hypothetical protein
MDTDDRPDLRCGGEPKFLLKPETERIIRFASELRVGLILNFKNARLEFERVVL